MLSERGIDFTYRDLIKEPLADNEVKSLAKAGNLAIRDLVNQRSQAFKKLNPQLGGLDDQAIIQLILAHPRIMVRPILVGDKKFLTGYKVADYENIQ